MMVGRDQPQPAAAKEGEKDGGKGGGKGAEEGRLAGKAAAGSEAGKGSETRGPLDDAEVVAQALTFILAG